MKLFLATLWCSAVLCMGLVPAGAQATPPVGAADCPAGTTFVAGYTKTNGTAVAAHCKKFKKKTAAGDAMSTATPAAMASAAPAMATSAAPGMAGASPSPSTKKHHHKKSDSMGAATPPAAMGATTPAAMGTPAAAMSAAPAMSSGMSKSTTSATPLPGTTSCPEGKSYVHGYTKKNGKQVQAYCRKSEKSN